VVTRPARAAAVRGALRPAHWTRPTSPGGWALLAVRTAGVLVAVTFAVTGIWHTLDSAWSAVRWPWLWTAYAAVPLAAVAVMLRFPDDRPADLSFLTGALALITGFVTAGYALVEGWFWPAAALSATGLAATVAVAGAVES
jgi:hypothetical protein